jgi:hypothetical protein
VGIVNVGATALVTVAAVITTACGGTSTRSHDSAVPTGFPTTSSGGITRSQPIELLNACDLAWAVAHDVLGTATLKSQSSVSFCTLERPGSDQTFMIVTFQRVAPTVAAKPPYEIHRDNYRVRPREIDGLGSRAYVGPGTPETEVAWEQGEIMVQLVCSTGDKSLVDCNPDTMTDAAMRLSRLIA